jgi:hypothetical protein
MSASKGIGSAITLVTLLHCWVLATFPCLTTTAATSLRRHLHRAYDSENRLVNTNKNGSMVSFAYDPLGGWTTKSVALWVRELFRYAKSSSCGSVGYGCPGPTSQHKNLSFQ